MICEIQPLRIPGGWSIEFNNFLECEIEQCENKSCLTEDLLRLQNHEYELLIDLGWYYDTEENGRFVLELIRKYDWKNPLESFESRDRKVIVEKIEKWTNGGFFSK